METTKAIKNMSDENDVPQEMARSFNCLEEDLNSINANQSSLIEFIHARIESSEKFGGLLDELLIR